jgi:phosphoribosylformylglycinamidine synthase subunit PurL
LRSQNLLFGEGGARILVSVSPEKQHTWENYLEQNLDHQWQKIGKVGNLDNGLQVLTNDNQTVIEVKIEEMSDKFFHAIERRLVLEP